MPSPALAPSRATPRRLRLVPAAPEKPPMTPYRLVTHPLGFIASTSSTSLGVGAAVLGIITGFQAWLFAGLIVAMLLDGATGANRARTNVHETYDPHADARGWRSKLSRLALVLLALVIDTMLVAVSRELWPTLSAGFARGWVTAGAIGWLFRVEALSVIDNVKRTQGAAVIPPGMKQALDQLGGIGEGEPRSQRRRRAERVQVPRIAPAEPEP